jgi:hypothetical protein
MTDTKNQRWKTGDELLPFHPDASHVSPDFRDGWNACYAVGSMNLKPSGTEALKEAIEGECDGLAITDEQANNILLFVFGQASVRTPKPLDDPRLQELFGSEITGALAFGAQGMNKPPEGHWLIPFWEMARAERESSSAHRVEVRQNEDGSGSLDEVVGVGQFHLEQMDDNLWWLRVEAAGRAVVVWLRSKRKIVATSEEEYISTPAGKDEPRRTGAAPGMLQDDDRGLSSWLANQPDARRLARDAAETVAADSKPGYGWRLVPPEPTPEMLDAGERSLFIPPNDARCLDAQRTWADQCADAYRAMLAAVRTPAVSLTPSEDQMVAWFSAFTKDRCDCFFESSLVRAWIEDLRAGRPYVPGPGAEPQADGLTNELVASGFARASSMHSTIPRMCEDYFRQGAAFAMRTAGRPPAIPVGSAHDMVLVPRRMTQAMIFAASDVMDEPNWTATLEKRWAAIINAAMAAPITTAGDAK